MPITIAPGETDIAGTLSRILTELEVKVTRALDAAATLPAAEQEFRAGALKRLFTDLAPMVDLLRARVQRGVLTATSDTEVLLVAGVVRSWIVAEADRTSFGPSPFLLALRRLSPLDSALVRLTDWDPATGILQAEVVEIVGDPGPHADWEFVSGPGLVYAQRAWLAEGRTTLTDTRAARDVVTTTAAQVASDKLIIGMNKAAAEQAASTATAKAGEAAASADRAATFDPSSFYPRATVDQKLADAATATDTKLSALKGSADAAHDTLGELATLVDAATAAAAANAAAVSRLQHDTARALRAARIINARLFS